MTYDESVSMIIRTALYCPAGTMLPPRVSVTPPLKAIRLKRRAGLATVIQPVPVLVVSGSARTAMLTM